MLHEMKLQPEFFEYMNSGTKTIELRLYDEKRKLINIGDEIIFKKEPELKDELKTKVIGLLRYESFAKLFADIPMSMLAHDKMTQEELLCELEKFYTKEKQKQYGVLGIRVEKIK